MCREIACYVLRILLFLSKHTKAKPYSIDFRQETVKVQANAASEAITDTR